MLGYESPLYGRRTGQYKIQALTYKEMTVFNPDLTNEDQALIYGITAVFRIISISWMLRAMLMQH